MRFIKIFLLLLCTFLLYSSIFQVAVASNNGELFIMHEKDGIVYLLFNSNAYDYVYNNFYVFKGSKGFSYYNLINPDTIYSKFNVTVRGNATILLPPNRKSKVFGHLSNGTFNYFSNIGLRVESVIIFGKYVMINVFNDSKINEKADIFRNNLEKFLRQNVSKIIIRFYPLTSDEYNREEEIIKKLMNIGNISNGISGIGINPLTLMISIDIYTPFLRSKGISEKPILDYVRSAIGDENYPIEVIFTNSIPEAGPLPADTYKIIIAFYILLIITALLIVTIIKIKKK